MGTRIPTIKVPPGTLADIESLAQRFARDMCFGTDEPLVGDSQSLAEAAGDDPRGPINAAWSRFSRWAGDDPLVAGLCELVILTFEEDTERAVCTVAVILDERDPEDPSATEVTVGTVIALDLANLRGQEGLAQAIWSILEAAARVAVHGRQPVQPDAIEIKSNR